MEQTYSKGPNTWSVAMKAPRKESSPSNRATSLKEKKQKPRWASRWLLQHLRDGHVTPTCHQGGHGSDTMRWRSVNYISSNNASTRNDLPQEERLIILRHRSRQLPWRKEQIRDLTLKTFLYGYKARSDLENLLSGYKASPLFKNS